MDVFVFNEFLLPNCYPLGSPLSHPLDPDIIQTAEHVPGESRFPYRKSPMKHRASSVLPKMSGLIGCSICVFHGKAY